jgi:predicted DNA-binding protein (MmcQ/YjbR family)
VQFEDIRGFCLSFPRAQENLQWGDQLCFKVGGKMFAILGLDSVPQPLCFKCAPLAFEELLEREGIRPAPYLGRYQWVLIEAIDRLPARELEALLQQSYALVSAKTKLKRPKSGARKKSRKPRP